MTSPVRSKVNRLLLAALAATPLMAGAASGEFTFVVGEVSLTKASGQRVTPARGTPVDAGDRIATGSNGMAQLTMVDNARLSLRPGTQFQIEAYPDKKDSQDGVVLSLLRGTLRTFTGLLASTNRDKYVMKTRVATVGIRGSGNILYACEGTDCDPSVASGEAAQSGVTVNHTIEGSHAVSNNPADARAGVPAQQGGAATLITGPGQTVLVSGFQAPRYIPTPQFISDAAVSMVSAKPAPPAVATATAAAESRNFSPSDVPALPASQRGNVSLVGNNGLGFANDLDAAQNAGADPLGLQDVVISAGAPFLGQAQGSQVRRNENQFRGYLSYPNSVGGDNIDVAISNGTLRDSHLVIIGSVPISMGRYENADLGLFGPGSTNPVPGSVHWIYGPSGFPAYISDVQNLTGTATYALVGSTAPTNQNNTVGALGSAQLFVSFSARTMGMNASVTMPAAGGNAGGSWTLTTGAVPFAFNQFSASTSDLLTISNGPSTSQNNTSLTGSFQGSFVGTGLTGAILGYGINDLTSGNPSNWNIVSGVAAFEGAPVVDPTANYREGRVSDPNNTLTDFIRSYATTDRPDEVTADATGRATSFAAAYAGGPHATYSIGTAQVVQSGIDSETGLVWGRWSSGTATVSRDGQTFNIPLASASLHYIFAGTQNGPVQLPLNGQVAYTVLGSTSPTDSAGRVGTLGNATLNVNFDARTVNAAVNINIANQQWSGSANNMPIYREQYFSAYSGGGVAGLPNPNPLVISCSPNCGQGANGSLDGFFAGRTGQRAGMMYNLGGNQGAVAFTRPGG